MIEIGIRFWYYDQKSDQHSIVRDTIKKDEKFSEREIWAATARKKVLTDDSFLNIAASDIESSVIC